MIDITARELREERLYRLQQQYYQKNPIAWLTERLGESEEEVRWSMFPEYAGHQWDGDVDPLYHAWMQLAEGNWVGVEAATGTSKTFMLARIVMWFLDVFENSLVVTSAPKQDQLKLNLWSEIGRIMHKFKKIRPDAQLYNLRMTPEYQDAQLITEDEAYSANTWQAVGFVAGVGADEESAQKARGFHRRDMLIILEEATGTPPAIMTAFQNTSTGENNLILAVGNPDNEFDSLHRFCMQGNVKHYRISAYDYPNVVLGKEIFAGAVTRGSISRRKETYGESSPLYNAMVRGISPAQAKDSLIRLDWVEQCVGLELGEADLDSYNAVGVDVSNSLTGDKASIVWGKGATCVAFDEFQCDNATHLAYNLFMSEGELLDNFLTDYDTYKMSMFDIEADCIGVDAVGVGVATVNALRDEGYEPQALHGGQWEEVIPTQEFTDENGDLKEKPMYRFANLRTQMYWEAREDLRRKLVSFKVLPDLEHKLKQLIRELCIPKYTTKMGVIALEPKEDIKKRMGGKSPNLADAFVYWNWTRKGYRIDRFGFAAISAG